MTQLNPDIQQQIAQEAQEISAKFKNDNDEYNAGYKFGLEIGYEAGARKYALRLQQAEEMMGRMAALLNEAMIPVYQIGTKEADALFRSIKKELAKYNTYKQQKYEN